MTTDIEIASQACLLLRAETISSFSEDKSEAQIMNTLYGSFVESILAIYPWTFATKKRQLNQDTTAPIGEYQYSHIIPSECMLLWALFSTNSVNSVPITDYDIYGVEGGRRIYSNYSALYGDYTVYTNENNWPAYFRNFAIHALAAHVAIPITGDSDLAAYYTRVAYGSDTANRKGGLLGVAMSTDSKQKRNEYIFSSPIVAARFS